MPRQQCNACGIWVSKRCKCTLHPKELRCTACQSKQKHRVLSEREASELSKHLSIDDLLESLSHNAACTLLDMFKDNSSSPLTTSYSTSSTSSNSSSPPPTTSYSTPSTSMSPPRQAFTDITNTLHNARRNLFTQPPPSSHTSPCTTTTTDLNRCATCGGSKPCKCSDDDFTGPSTTTSSHSTTTSSQSTTTSPPSTQNTPKKRRGERGRHSRCTEITKWRCVIYSADKLLSQAAIARKFRCSRNTVRRWVNAYEKYGSVDEIYLSGDRPRKRKLNWFETASVSEYAKRVKFCTPRTILAALGLHVSTDTIDRRLIEIGLFGRVARKRHPKMDPKKRLSFANGYLKADFNRWIFSDEASIWIGRNKRIYVRRPRGDEFAYADEYVAPYTHHSHKIHIIGFFTSQGVGACAVFEENMDGDLLAKLLQKCLLQTAQLHFPTGQWFLLHDNDKKFHSKVVTDWCHNNGVLCIDFPPYSPDLNPTENLWADMKRRVMEFPPENKEELIEAAYVEWYSTPKAFCKSLVDSMPNRCLEVIANNGYKTKY